MHNVNIRIKRTHHLEFDIHKVVCQILLNVFHAIDTHIHMFKHYLSDIFSSTLLLLLFNFFDTFE